MMEAMAIAAVIFGAVLVILALFGLFNTNLDDIPGVVTGLLLLAAGTALVAWGLS